MDVQNEAVSGDLPELLDALTVAVTTLDAVGVDRFRDLYLYVVGMSGDRVVRDLRMEDGKLIVGPPQSQHLYPTYFAGEFEANRRALMLADLCYLMHMWNWSPSVVAGYLRCTESLLLLWIRSSTGVSPPRIPVTVTTRIKRLSVVDQIRTIGGIMDRETPGWLAKRRTAFGARSIEQILLSDDATGYAQVVMWGLNYSRSSAESVH